MPAILDSREKRGMIVGIPVALVVVSACLLTPFSWRGQSDRKRVSADEFSKTRGWKKKLEIRASHTSLKWGFILSCA